MTLLFKVWSSGQKHQHCLGRLYKCRTSSYILYLCNQNLHLHMVSDELLMHYISQALLYEVDATVFNFCGLGNPKEWENLLDNNLWVKRTRIWIQGMNSPTYDIHECLSGPLKKLHSLGDVLLAIQAPALCLKWGSKSLQCSRREVLEQCSPESIFSPSCHLALCFLLDCIPGVTGQWPYLFV